MLNLDYIRFKLQRQGLTTVRVQLRKYNGSSYVSHVEADVSADGQQGVALSTDGSSKFQVRIFSSTYTANTSFTLDDFSLSKDSACPIYWSQDTGVYRFGFNGQMKDDEVSGAGNSYTAEFWQYDGRLGRRWNIDPVVKDWQSPYATFDNNPIYFSDPSGAVAEGTNEGNLVGTEDEPMEYQGYAPKEVVISAKKPSALSRIWKKTIRVVNTVSDYVPVVGGIKHAINAARVGDWKGAALGLGEAAVDGVLLVTTAGIGNAIKSGTKLGIKATAKVLSKETAEGLVSNEVNEQLGITNPILQGTVSVLLGVHAKPRFSVKKIQKISESRLGKGNRVRIDDPKTDPKGNWLGGSNGRKEITFSDGRSLYDDGSWKHGANGADPSTATLTNIEIDFLNEIGWKLP